ncbi:hypothetical protein LSH36_96g05027 [Paralvinella palmiformis]|uniref:Uncharacterized protein n=1 Tax=Paralvinella palmiformis TaxID=53620 RepID=A0AAD9K0Q9_9ANNE|nr:hypothetical protein LSH36_96g05027 [Paralvinella palmiformis]
MADGVLTLLCSSAKIERDRGVQELLTFIKDANKDDIVALQKSLHDLLSNTDSTWEGKHGALIGTKALLESGNFDETFANSLQEFAVLHLDYDESRVRLAAGEILGTLCRCHGTSVYDSIKDRVLEGVLTNLQRQPLEESSKEEQKHAEQLTEKIAGADKSQKRRNSADAEQIFHDTAGWKSLETYMKCLQAVIDGCGPGFNKYIDVELLSLISQTLTHTNRFVRETGYYVCSSLVSCNSSKDGTSTCSAEDNEIYKNGLQFAEQLARGLADNWSQVRLAASGATRCFLMGLPPENRKEFFAQLLPPLCLNRYYVAEGVRIYNQKTWKEVTEGQGKELLEQYIQQVVEFYISQTEADNHAVREAACACIAELGSKIDKDVVRPFVAKLLDALLVCFKDESWPVRDASCVSCGNFVLCFPDEARDTMEALYPLFYENLQDNIQSVREGAAIAMANVVRAYGRGALDVVLLKIKEGLEGVEKQSANVEKYSGLDKKPATYGVVKRLRDNDMELHTDQQMYSCGSLAPKMHRGKRGGGCMDHKFRRPPEPWEFADGCVNLISQLSSMESAKQDICKLLALMASASSHQHYTQHVHFLETVCKQIPFIAKGLGKRTFKMYLELFFDAIFYSIRCDNALTQNAANLCLNQLSTLLGPSILRGRVEQYNPRYLEYLSSAQFAAPL